MKDKGEDSEHDQEEERKKGVDRSKWKVVDTPQDASLMPTLAVTLWLGWMGFLVKGSIWVVFWSSAKTKLVWIGLCTMSLVLPPRFPEPFGRTVVGAWLMTHAERYFGLKTTVEDPDELQHCAQTSALIFAKEPHDVLPYSVFCFADSIHRVLPQQSVSALTTGAIFQIPFIKQVYSWVGCCPVDKKTFRRKLERKESFCFVPGGAQEVLMLSDNMRAVTSATTTTTTEERLKEEERRNAIPLYLKNRKGFVKMALSTGSPIVPVFAFGLDRSYDYWIPPGLSKVSRKMGFVPVLFTGRFGIPFGIPKPTKIHVVIGRPIMIPKITDDDQNKDATLLSTMIEKYHTTYLEELEALYERHKHDEGYGHRKLIIF